ncbi:hypothetical protein I315_06804 [Cryptococcus gattii Ru294]|uniref:Uncharacterized protein n=2 Tax=Cryptococcus gattii TaxID=37769 RepID=E6RF03_CRYGW|nr:Hypothetical Protein CGB_M0280C [Cryptococcus gattii WM276]KIR50762.1 hypothetical protein I315_06804 [Cryptococcus gattii Ru294]KIR78977.1 hypothetical protein I306_04022 [Cryptococcus gattii EJB2]KIY30754.1 hypothetical protein I305_06834 [Cryptococcus gattii E566]KJD99977.1 hypothetical protein I311_06441 [Cryptococcus gattii NT-10]ADV25432.1 Hypothetical Protein CGB_M0280C [Cryptococcus gattii WM276]
MPIARAQRTCVGRNEFTEQERYEALGQHGH